MLTVAVMVRFLHANQKLITICGKTFSADELRQFGAKLFSVAPIFSEAVP
jgi:hypothetical protein